MSFGLNRNIDCSSSEPALEVAEENPNGSAGSTIGGCKAQGNSALLERIVRLLLAVRPHSRFLGNFLVSRGPGGQLAVHKCW